MKKITTLLKKVGRGWSFLGLGFDQLGKNFKFVSIQSNSTCHIPVDIVEKNLLKLPTKSIFRFQSVCKTWYHLSKSFRFAALHMKETDSQYVVHYSFNRKEMVSSLGHEACEKSSAEIVLYSEALRSENGGLVSHHALETTSDKTSRLFKVTEQIYCGIWEFKLVGKCNGILCITMKVGNWRNYVDIFLINPCLNHMKKIRSPPSDYGYFQNLCGLEFDPLSNTFKVVTMPVSRREKETAHVYNLSTHSWSKVRGIPLKTLSINHSSVFFNGVIHWCAHTKDSDRQMLTFNTTTELFQLMNLPKGDRVRAKPSLLVLNQELLAFVSTESNLHFRKNQCVSIWVMKEYGVEESWTKLYSIGPLENIIEPLSFWEEDKILLRTKDTKDEKLVSYDMLLGRVSGSIDLSGNTPSGHPRSNDYSLGYLVCKECLTSFSSI